MTVKVEWLVGSDKALAEVGTKATARNVLVRTLKKAGQPTLEAMRANAPRDTGWTADSFDISTQLNPTNRRDVKRQGKAFAEVYVGTDRGSAAVFEEFGTIKQPPHPFLRPAYEANKEGAEQIIATELWVEIKKATERAARKAAKAV